MKMKKLFGFLASLLILVGSNAFAQGSSKCIPVNLSKDKMAFKGGEKLVFTLHYKWGAINADVAQATLKTDSTVFNGKKAYHTSLRGKTQRFYEAFFKVKEDFDTWYTIDGMKPLKSSRDCREGGYECTNFYTYGKDRINAVVKTSRKGEFSAVLPYDECTYDIPLLFCVIRNIDMARMTQGVNHTVTYACDDKVETVNLRFLGKENKKVPGIGTVRCLKFGFSVKPSEVFEGGSDLYCWLSDDDNKMLVWVSAPMKVGEVQGRLRSYSGLKHNFDALVK